MVDDFVDRFRDHDAVVMSTYNFIHPEVLTSVLRNQTRILGMIDDPLSTYMRGIPYLWAFDGVFHISPTYLNGSSFDEAVRRWTKAPTYWWPLVPRRMPRPDTLDERFFRNRDVDIVYVGNPSNYKMERLSKLKKHFGSRLTIRGRWPLAGWYGLARVGVGKRSFPHRVRRLTEIERTELYWRTKIGLNMHVSPMPSESGNMRTYEVPAHGMLLVSDRGAGGGQSRIFHEGSEALYYSTTDEAIDLIEHALENEEQRIAIAKQGFDRFWRDYEWERNLLAFLSWVVDLRGKSGMSAI
jgi:spore maturation protein CgeB